MINQKVENIILEQEIMDKLRTTNLVSIKKKKHISLIFGLIP